MGGSLNGEAKVPTDGLCFGLALGTIPELIQKESLKKSK